MLVLLKQTQSWCRRGGWLDELAGRPEDGLQLIQRRKQLALGAREARLLRAEAAFVDAVVD